MVKSKSQSVNIELEKSINSKRSKRETSTSGNRTNKSKNSVEEDFEEREIVRNIWAYEIIPFLNGTICTRVEEESARPCLLNWKADVTVTGAQLEKDIFDLLIFQVNNFKETDEDKHEVYASSLFEKSRN
ncbi:Uncharacterized protein Fot_34644 [Forsythia ovata]|uniref:Uncharacterized protein n=1 Tax=Forsythia ovata TaxID=205694 RepID=A0ABD1SJ92_9LAMI